MTTQTIVLQIPVAPDLGRRLEELATERGLSTTDLAAAILGDALAHDHTPAVIRLDARDHQHLARALDDPPPPRNEALALARRYRSHTSTSP